MSAGCDSLNDGAVDGRGRQRVGARARARARSTSDGGLTQDDSSRINRDTGVSRSASGWEAGRRTSGENSAATGNDTAAEGTAGRKDTGRNASSGDSTVANTRNTGGTGQSEGSRGGSVVGDGRVADLGKLGSSKSDKNRRSKRDIQNVLDLDTNIDGNTSHDLQGIGNREGTAVGVGERGGVVKEVNPKGDLRAGLEANAIETGFDADLGAQTEAEVKVDLSGEVNTSTKGDGEGLSEEALTIIQSARNP